MHFVLSLFCDGRVVEIFILRLVHLESGIFHDEIMFSLFRLGLLNHCRNGLSFFDFCVVKMRSLSVVFFLSSVTSNL